jgi:hypothetical protein
MKHGIQVATVLRSSAGNKFGHVPEEPWLLHYTNGRIERYGACHEARDAALKI